MRPAPLCRCGLRGLLDRIHPVDKSLLLFMLVLLIQSAYSMFCPGGTGQAAEDIDIIVRTSAAAIFGYFLSANFIRHTASGGQTPPRRRAAYTGDGWRHAPGPRRSCRPHRLCRHGERSRASGPGNRQCSGRIRSAR